MIDNMPLWLVVFFAGIITFSLRFVLLAIAGRWQPSPQIQGALRFVPITVLGALVVGDVIPNSLDNIDIVTWIRVSAVLLVAIAVLRGIPILGALLLGMLWIWGLGYFIG